MVKDEKMDKERQPEDDRGREAGPESRGYLILLFIVQLLSVGIWLSEERVHQHQEGHVEQKRPHHRQVDDNDDLRKTSALFNDPASRVRTPFLVFYPPWLPAG